MPKSLRLGAPLVGIVFLLLAVFKFLTGHNWIVWLILAFLFGGFRFFFDKAEKEPEA
ncbi:conserved hypothetical protein [Altererythrobacter sp. B11]|uniref:hypothetical protein n=1 Tax=Altererythrobacter sp. B11 TaxID=2060312 RepID=UPI000DC6DF9D|nr:hypothetical protein [Altererythrobacter sp. B11]BBC73005.1 conserved hypothetical protein [Altererythrobacter sp. B11]